MACAIMPDQAHDPLALGRGEAGQRLVQQQDLGLGRERHAHVDEPLPAVGERIGLHLLDALEAEEGDQLRRLAVDLLDTVRGGQGAHALGVLALNAQADVLLDGQPLEEVGDLERAGEAALGDLVRAGARRRAPRTAGSRRHQAGTCRR